MSRTPIIMDVDTGIDDAFAILLAAAARELEIVAMTTVFGNRPVEDTTRNTLKICELLGIKAPVARGAEKALLLPKLQLNGAEVHGKDGLGNMGYLLPEPEKQLSELSAVELMAKVLTESAEPVTLVPVGPLTNIAILLLTCPHLLPKIDKIVIMGGALSGGNVTARGEANVYHDPEAAKIVLSSGLRIMLSPLDATMKAYATKEDHQRMAACGNYVSDTLCRMLFHYEAFYANKAGFQGVALHDSVPVAWLIDHHVVETRALYVDVELGGTVTRGSTCADRRVLTDKKPNAAVAVNVDRERFIELHVEAFRKFGN